MITSLQEQLNWLIMAKKFPKYTSHSKKRKTSTEIKRRQPVVWWNKKCEKERNIVRVAHI